MKTGKKLLPAMLFFIAFVCNTPWAMAQKSDSAQEASIKKIVAAQRYVFYAESAIPMKGKQQFLSPGNTVRISKDTVVCDLPYFGRSYTATVSADGGIKFTAASFEYTPETRKKGGWEITIKTKDVTDTQTLVFTIYENGKAYLQVRSNNRQGISFNGYIASPL